MKELVQTVSTRLAEEREKKIMSPIHNRDSKAQLSPFPHILHLKIQFDIKFSHCVRIPRKLSRIRFTPLNKNILCKK